MRPLDDQRARLDLAGEAANAAWRAWRYPMGNRSAAMRGAVEPDLGVVPQETREARAEAAWEEVLRRDPRLLG